MCLAGEYHPLLYFFLGEYLIVIHLGATFCYLAYTTATCSCKARVGDIQAFGQQFTQNCWLSLYCAPFRLSEQ